MALFGHAGGRSACLLMGEDRKRAAVGQNDANDPQQTFGRHRLSSGKSFRVINLFPCAGGTGPSVKARYGGT